jgi:hypothetical protein
MPARPYRPSGLSDPGSLPLLVAGCFVAGGLAGVVESVVGRWIHLLVIFPLLTGLAVGAFAAWTIGRRRIRAPLLAAAVAGAGGFTAQLADHVTEYYRFRADIEEPARQRGLTVDEALEAMTGSPGFVGFMRLRAREGVTLQRAGESGDRGTHVSGAGSFVLWGVEALLAIGAAAGLAWSRASEPFCERCKLWYGGHQGVALGSPDKADVRAVIAALDARDVQRAVGALGAPKEDARSQLTLRRCTRCEEHEPLLSYQVVMRLKKKPQTRTRYRTLLRPMDATALLAAVAARPPASQAGPPATA